MASAAMVPMLAPDGTSGDVPQDRVADAEKAGFKIAVSLIAPNGQHGYVPEDKYADAIRAGFRPGVPQAPVPQGLQGAPLGIDQIPTGAQGVNEGARAGLGFIFKHPIQALESSGPTAASPVPFGVVGSGKAASAANQANNEFLKNAGAQGDAKLANLGKMLEMRPAYTLSSLIAPAVVGAALGKAIPEVPGEFSALRETAMGDPDAAALRGLHVSPQSPKALRTLESVQGSRPFLQGSKGLQDLQSRVAAAQEEIWQPYLEALDKIGDHPVKGPDGNMTTVQDLEDRRLELSAQLRTLRNGGPEAVALAQQKGLTQAGLLREEGAVKHVLDPQLRRAGIDPTAIRKAFAQVSTVGKRVAGKTTTGEASARYSLGKLENLSLKRPVSNITTLWNAAVDRVAGRPWFADSPTDVNIREAFRIGGPKPNFTVSPSPSFAGFLERGAIPLESPEFASSAPSAPQPVYNTTRVQRLGLLLPDQTGGPIELPYVPEMTSGEKLAALMQLLRKAPQGALPAKASAIRLGAPK